MKHTLTQQSNDADVPYVGVIGGKAAIIQRETETKTPNGNLMHGRWVLRIDGEMVDFDQYRSDLAERNDINLAYQPRHW